MFADDVLSFINRECNSQEQTDKIELLLLDTDDLQAVHDFTAALSKQGWHVAEYQDDLYFRLHHEEWLRANGRVAVLVRAGNYVPYDVQQEAVVVEVSLERLYPRLHAKTLRGHRDLNLDLLSLAYENLWQDCHTAQQTEEFLQVQVDSPSNVEAYLERHVPEILEQGRMAQDYHDWFRMAEAKAELDVLAAAHGLDADTAELNSLFEKYAEAQHSKLFNELDAESPVLVSKVMDFMYNRSNMGDRRRKFAIIVMDGMSWFDWQILSESFAGLRYTQTSVLAMIPTTTSISRQCLLSNKYPKSLDSPDTLNKEELEYRNCMRHFGITKDEAVYDRDYDGDAKVSGKTRCAAIIVNEMDDLAHKQMQGMRGMYQDVHLVAKKGELRELVKRLLARGMDVYITADHGMTESIGLGKKANGIAVQTGSHRMLMVRDVIQADSYTEQRMIEYKSPYLDGNFQYFISEAGFANDNKGKLVLTHGGMTLDETVVPFITLKVEDNKIDG